jgi:hypothetical protein
MGTGVCRAPDEAVPEPAEVGLGFLGAVEAAGWQSAGDAVPGGGGVLPGTPPGAPPGPEALVRPGWLASAVALPSATGPGPSVPACARAPPVPDPPGCGLAPLWSTEVPAWTST